MSRNNIPGITPEDASERLADKAAARQMQFRISSELFEKAGLVDVREGFGDKRQLPENLDFLKNIIRLESIVLDRKFNSADSEPSPDEYR